MAADWIKMRSDLQTHPKIVRILSATRSDKFRVVGGLHAVWAVFDTHSVDGVLEGYTPETMDHVIGWEGFSEAMIAVGWLAFDGAESLSMPEFEAHNGQSAKRRAEDQKRKKQSRSCPQSVRNLSADDEDNKRTREEKRREEEKEHTSSGKQPPADPPCPHEQVIAAYHETLPTLPRVRQWTDSRKRHLQARWREDRERQTLDWWVEFFEYIRASDFLMGRSKRSEGHEGFTCTLPWLLKAENFAKVLEGNYDNREGEA